MEESKSVERYEVIYRRQSPDTEANQNQDLIVKRLLGSMRAEFQGTEEEFQKKVKLYSDSISGAINLRPAWSEVEKDITKGLVWRLTTWKLDRIGRNVLHLYKVLELCQQHNVEFRSLTENIDTSTASGKAFFGMLAVFAQFERDMILERTKIGVERAKSQGRFPGRPKGSKDKRKRRKLGYCLARKKQRQAEQRDVLSLVSQPY